MALEKDVQHEIKKALRDLGALEWKDKTHLGLPTHMLARSGRVWVYDTSQPRRSMVTPGLPDLILVGFGTITFVEVKTPTGTMSWAQRLLAAVSKREGVPYLIWRGPEDVLEWWNSH